MKLTIALAFLGAALHAQQLDLSSLDKLSPKASAKAEVALDAEKLRLASKFLSSDKEGDQKAKELVAAMKGIFVRTYEFEKPGEFTDADLEAVRRQLKTPGWSQLVSVKDKNESAEVYFFSQNNQYGGLAVIASEPKELVVVNIVGPVDIANLARLAGSLGIPEIKGLSGGGARSTAPPKPKDDDDDEN